MKEKKREEKTFAVDTRGLGKWTFRKGNILNNFNGKYYKVDASNQG